MREDFEDAQQFFSELMKVPVADYTVYAAADDETAAAAYRKAFAKEPEPRFCFTANQGSALVMTLDCGRPLADYLGRYHHINLKSRLRDEAVAATVSPSRLEWLVARVGEQAIYTYLQQRSSSEPWRETFEAVFGMSVGE